MSSIRSSPLARGLRRGNERATESGGVAVCETQSRFHYTRRVYIYASARTCLLPISASLFSRSLGMYRGHTHIHTAERESEWGIKQNRQSTARRGISAVSLVIGGSHAFPM